MNDLTACTPDNEPNEGLWLSIAEVAKLKDVSRQGVHERVQRLEARGLISTRPGPGRTRLVNLAEYDAAVKETTDLVRSQNGGGATVQWPRSGSDSKILAHEQARRASYDADLKKLDLEQRRGELVAVAAVRDAAIQCGGVMVQLFDRLPSYADEIAAAVAKDGASGVRQFLKQLAHSMRGRAAHEFEKMVPPPAAPPPA